MALMSFMARLKSDARQRQCDSKFQDACRALCQAFVYISLARAILIASGLVMLGSICLGVHLLRPLPAATIPSQRSLSTHSRLNRLTGKGSAEMSWHLTSSFALLCLALHLGRKFDLLNQPPTSWLTSRFKLLLRWKKCKKAPQQVLKGKLQKYAAAAAAGSNSHTWDYLSAEHNSSEATSLNSSTIDSHGLIEERRIATRDRAGMVMSYYLTPEQQHMHRHQLDNSSLGAHVTKQQHQHIHQHQHNCKETCVTGAEQGGLVSIEGREKGKIVVTPQETSPRNNNRNTNRSKPICEIQGATEPGREGGIECEIKCERDGDRGGVKLRLGGKAAGEKGSENMKKGQENVQSTNNLRKRAQTALTSVDQE
mmetsp:Transcript_51104/g.74826  ORF Transcript_51104/g.74826 Transcript_51104/m.74826 type:complete len:368 (-) Transcript_51104:25-1128(-)